MIKFMRETCLQNNHSPTAWCCQGVAVALAVVFVWNVSVVHAQLPPVSEDSVPPSLSPTSVPPNTTPPATRPRPPAKQRPVSKTTPNRSTKARTGEEEDKGPPPPESVYLTTKDGWRIHCRYYAPKEGIKPGKSVVPIIMVHRWGGRESDFAYLASGLQTYGHAIIVPDLRGHGRSEQRRSPETGEFERVKYDELKPAEAANVVLDIEAAKKFLMEKNNAGEVNIELLCVIGAEEGTIIAVNWTAMDWSWPQTAAVKQGQDVKALILLSPMRTQDRMTAAKAYLQPSIRNIISILIVVGADDGRALREAKRIYDPLDRARPKPRNEEERRKLQSVFFIEAPTELQGTGLLDRALPVNRNIAGFIELRLARRVADFPWTDRTSPLSGN